MNLTVIESKKDMVEMPTELSLVHWTENYPGDAPYHCYKSSAYPGIVGRARNPKIAMILFLEGVTRHLRDSLAQ